MDCCGGNKESKHAGHEEASGNSGGVNIVLIIGAVLLIIVFVLGYLR